tara:strand:+ start:1169 stop:1393 length:225 start_codon:yes stop_codon:yes gene_type:complete
MELKDKLDIFDQFPDEPIEIECFRGVRTIGGDGTIYLQIHKKDLEHALRDAEGYGSPFRDFVLKVLNKGLVDGK